jgi:hypothetical protein
MGIKLINYINQHQPTVLWRISFICIYNQKHDVDVIEHGVYMAISNEKGYLQHQNMLGCSMVFLSFRSKAMWYSPQ